VGFDPNPFRPVDDVLEEVDGIVRSLEPVDTLDFFGTGGDAFPTGFPLDVSLVDPIPWTVDGDETILRPVEPVGVALGRKMTVELVTLFGFDGVLEVLDEGSTHPDGAHLDAILDPVGVGLD